jgi:hypothetical protein
MFSSFSLLSIMLEFSFGATKIRVKLYISSPEYWIFLTELLCESERIHSSDSPYCLALSPHISIPLPHFRPPLWSSGKELLATDPEVLGSISGASRFSEKQRVWNGVHSAS